MNSKNALLTGILLATAMIANADAGAKTYRFIAPVAGIDEKTVWETVNESCTDWAPDPSSVQQGAHFQQSQTCTITENSNKDSSRTRTVEQFRDNVGTMAETWTMSGSYYACDAWAPETSTVNQGETFTQSRECSADYTSNFGGTKTERTVVEKTATGTYVPPSTCAYTSSSRIRMTNSATVGGSGTTIFTVGIKDEYHHTTPYPFSFQDAFYLASKKHYVYAGKRMASSNGYKYYEYCYIE